MAPGGGSGVRGSDLKRAEPFVVRGGFGLRRSDFKRVASHVVRGDVAPGGDSGVRNSDSGGRRPPSSVTIALVVLALFGGFAAWVYRRLEFPAPGRSLLLATRIVVLATLAAILWNPAVPKWGARQDAASWVILDASLSMAAKGEDGETLWDHALARAGALANEGARVLAAGDGVRGVAVDSLRSLAPEGAASRLAPAFSAAAEAGAREVTLLTDRRIEDPVALAAAARRLGVGLSADTAWGSGRAAANLGISKLVLPATSAGSSPLSGRFEVEGDWGADSVFVSVSVDGTPRQVLRLGGDRGWGVQAADFVVAPPLAPGPRRISVRLLHAPSNGAAGGPDPAPSAGPEAAAAVRFADAFSLDDQRSAIVRIDAEEAGIVLVALAPGWEARFLLPVLQQVTGLPVRGFVRTGPDRFHPMLSAGGAAGTLHAAVRSAGNANAAEGSAGDPAPLAPGAEDAGFSATTLARLARRAGLVVALGADASNRDLLGDAVAGARRLLVFAGDAAGAELGGVAAVGALAGEWFVEAASPSPVAGDLAGVSWQGLPPLAGLLSAEDDVGRALGVRRREDAETRPAVVLRQDGDTRKATVLADGFWRWAARDGSSREAYRRLWAAVAGWAAAGAAPSVGPGASPAQPVVPRGRPVRWRTAGDAGDSLRLTVRPVPSAAAALAPAPLGASRSQVPGATPSSATPSQVPGATSSGASPSQVPRPPLPGASLDTAFVLTASGGAFLTPALPPGFYEYQASLSGQDAVGGAFEVESFTHEMLRPAVDPSLLSAPAPGGRAAGPVRPLRTSPLPYLLALAALCAEWTGRRRAGLR